MEALNLATLLDGVRMCLQSPNVLNFGVIPLKVLNLAIFLDGIKMCTLKYQELDIRVVIFSSCYCTE